MERAWQRIHAHFVLSRPAILDGQLAQLEALAAVALDTVVTPRADAVFDIRRGRDEVVLLYNRAQITFPATVEAALRFATTTPRYRVVEIPDTLDAGGKLVLIRRLIREGLLVARIGS